MNRDIFNELTSKEKSGWLKAAKRRKKWRWIRKPIFRLRVKYYRLKRAFLLFLRIVSNSVASDNECRATGSMPILQSILEFFGYRSNDF